MDMKLNGADDKKQRGEPGRLFRCLRVLQWRPNGRKKRRMEG